MKLFSKIFKSKKEKEFFQSPIITSKVAQPLDNYLSTYETQIEIRKNEAKRYVEEFIDFLDEDPETFFREIPLHCMEEVIELLQKAQVCIPEDYIIKCRATLNDYLRSNYSAYGSMVTGNYASGGYSHAVGYYNNVQAYNSNRASNSCNLIID